MHILLAILGILGGLGVWFWRIRTATDAAREIKDVAETALNLPRKLAFRRRSGKTGAALVTDPREAATILMLETARAAGEVTTSQKAMIRAKMVQHFEFPAPEADEILVQAAWVSAEEAGTDKLHRTLARIITESVGPQERQDLIDMLLTVAEVDGGPTQAQEELIASLRPRLLPAS